MVGFIWLCIIQIVKIIINWKVYNILHSESKIKMRPRYSGMWIRENAKGIQEISDSNFMFIYCNFILFWIKIPKKRKGKIMAWSVLGFTLCQALIIIFNDWSGL
jgi:hypothetical protein